MGSGPSNNKTMQPKQKSSQQPSSILNRKNMTRPVVGFSYPLVNSPKPSEQNRTQSIRSSQVSIRTLLPQVQNRNERAGVRRMTKLLNGTEPSFLPHQQNNNSDNDVDEIQLIPIKNSEKKHRTSADEKSSMALTGGTSRCAFCSHCKYTPQVIVNKPTYTQPVWITKPPPQTNQHVMMDNYDKEAVRIRIISHGRILGSYNCLPNLIIENKKDHKQISKNDFKLPILGKPESLKLPVRAPLPNSDTLQRREKHLNKRSPSTFFTDCYNVQKENDNI